MAVDSSMARSLKHRAYAHIRQKLLNGQMVGGTRVSDRVLAKEIGVSRTPVREAMRELESVGLLKALPTGGALVAIPEARDLGELYEVRLALELYAVGVTAKRATPSQIAELRKLVERHLHACRSYAPPTKGGDNSKSLAVVTADMQFHQTILRIAGNRRLIRLTDDLQLAVHMFGHSELYTHHDVIHLLATDVSQHWRIFQAIRAHQPVAAKRAMTKHLLCGKRMAKRYLRELEYRRLSDS